MTIHPSLAQPSTPPQHPTHGFWRPLPPPPPPPPTVRPSPPRRRSPTPPSRSRTPPSLPGVMDNLHFRRPQRLHLHQKVINLCALSVILFVSAFPTASAEIKNMRIVDDSRPMILFEQFGFNQGGDATVSVKRVSWKSLSRRQDVPFQPGLMGFVLIRQAAYDRVDNESRYTAGGYCPLSSRYVHVLFTFQALGSAFAYNGSVSIAESDEYSLLFSNCQSGFLVSMDVHTEMYNVRDGGEKDFLPIGQIPLPKLYFVFSLVYAAFLLAWVAVCVQQRPTVDKIHMIMGALLLFKALKLVCAAEDMSFVRQTGTPHGWDIVFYIFGFLKGVTLFTVIVLIGTGWSFLKPYLQEREKKVLMVVIPLQVVENIASIIIGESGPAERDWLTWNQIFLLVDIICCCAVFFPIIWSIRSLREASKTDGKAARNLAKLTLFRHFYVVVVGYLYFTRIVISAVAALLNYRQRWVSTALVEGASLAFYVFVFYNFQPVERNPYLFIHDEEEAAAARELENDEEFEL
ncbi:hypothetical protein Taro_054555 [Colocasia esculenta]|uniref:Protein GPR107 n=1 Tax=Colocasia esculenta TaxID=4460 RepID=A0A843XP02_COLES|nr:hypothetical protein [Colocasia esculenta]